MTSSAPSITQEIALLDLQIEKLKPQPVTHPLEEVRNPKPQVEETRVAKRNHAYPPRADKDRRSGDDRREVGDLNYFKKGGLERRLYMDRRVHSGRRKKQAQKKSRGLANLLDW